MKNGSITDQLKMQNELLASEKRNEEMKISLHADKQIGKDEDLKQSIETNKQEERKKRNKGLKR